MDDIVSVFDEATRDYEAERHTAVMKAAVHDAEAVWPFLALSLSPEEFGNRLALSKERLTMIAQRHGVSYEDITAPLARGFAILMEARLPGGDVHAKCGNCGHSNPGHADGSPCSCGCTSFQATQKTAGSGAWLGEPVPEGSIGNPSRQEMHDEAMKRGRGPAYAPSSVHSLDLHGSTSSPETFYTEGYDHARESGSYDNYKGYGSRDKTLAYGHGFRHGLADHPLSSTSKTAGNGTYDISENCHRGGDGNCDGWTSGGTGCNCACHDEPNLPDTMEGVKAWHDGLYKSQDDYDPNYAGEGQWGGYVTRVHKATLHTADQYGVDRQERAGDSTKDEHIPGFAQTSHPTAPYGQHPYGEGEDEGASDAAADRVRNGWGNGMGHDIEKGAAKGDPCYHPLSCSACQRQGHACGQHHAGQGAGHQDCRGQSLKPGNGPFKGASRDPYALIHQALMDGQDPLEWVRQQNPPGSTESHHDTTQQFVQGGPTAAGPVAYTQAMEQAGTPGQPEVPGGHQTTQEVDHYSAEDRVQPGQGQGQSRHNDSQRTAAKGPLPDHLQEFWGSRTDDPRDAVAFCAKQSHKTPAIPWHNGDPCISCGQDRSSWAPKKSSLSEPPPFQ